MISATGLELRAGSRILLSEATLRVQPGDRIGLVGRNGAGKTTTLRVLAGEGQPYAGEVLRRGELGYLPQDPREGDLSVTAKDRVLSARGLDQLLRDMEKAQSEMAELADDRQRDKAVARYGRLEERFAARGGYAAESEAGRICSNLGLADRVLSQPLRTLSGGSGAASSSPASCSPPPRRDRAAGRRPRCCWTSRPTTSTPTRSTGCATSSRPTTAGSWSSATTSTCWPPW